MEYTTGGQEVNRARRVAIDLWVAATVAVGVGAGECTTAVEEARSLRMAAGHILPAVRVEGHIGHKRVADNHQRHHPCTAGSILVEVAHHTGDIPAGQVFLRPVAAHLAVAAEHNPAVDSALESDPARS